MHHEGEPLVCGPNCTGPHIHNYDDETGLTAQTAYWIDLRDQQEI